MRHKARLGRAGRRSICSHALRGAWRLHPTWPGPVVTAGAAERDLRVVSPELDRLPVLPRLLEHLVGQQVIKQTGPS